MNRSPQLVEDLKSQFEKIEFETHPSSIIEEAERDYLAQQDPLATDDVSSSFIALSIIGNHFVGQEPR
ncbi:MAG: hypothetical protein AAB629_02750 [Patescibacteria group bacterium]